MSGDSDVLGIFSELIIDYIILSSLIILIPTKWTFRISQTLLRLSGTRNLETDLLPVKNEDIVHFFFVIKSQLRYDKARRRGIL